jgi:hypothetical protein
VKLTWLFGGSVVASLLALLLLFQQGERQAPPPEKPLPSQAAARAADTAIVTPSTSSRVPTIRLVGLIHQGAGSSAMVEVQGIVAQPFHTGEAVVADWVLQKIGADHIIVGNGVQQARVELEAAQSATLGAPYQKPEQPSERKPDPMLGPPVALVPDDVARENNRRFVEAVRRRNSGM